MIIKPLTKKNLGEIAVRRNPLIADLFHRIHLVERVGSGIKRIKEECKKHGNVTFGVETNGYFISKFMLKRKINKKDGKSPLQVNTENMTKLGEKLGERLGENENRIIEIIMRNKYVSARELAEKIKISTTAIENNMAKLKEKGILRRVGSYKGGYWEVIKK